MDEFPFHSAQLPGTSQDRLKIVPLYVHLPFQTVIPVLLLIVAKIRKRS